MKIYLNIEAESPEEVRSVLSQLLGSTSFTTPVEIDDAQAEQGTSTSDVSSLSSDKPTTAPKRERGKPAQGKTRRTNAEIAEDDAADQADAAAAKAGAETGAVVADRQISTGGERVDPDNPEEAAQDAADEAAETEATKAASGKALTHDDARAALGKYVNRYGMEAALEDGPKVLNLLFGESVSKVSAIPDDQDSLSKAIAGIEEMLTKNPYGRKAEL